MTARATATRAEAIAAAIDKFEGDSFLEYWADSEYMRGICEVLADTFGVDDPENHRDSIWDEMRAAFIAEKEREKDERLRAKAEPIARTIADAEWAASNETGPDKSRNYNAILETARAAALAALTEKENA